jgi:uncharacterized membrane protein
MEILGALIVGLVLLAIPFVVPIVAWLSARGARRRIDALELLVAEQRRSLDKLFERLDGLTQSGQPLPAERAPAVAKPVTDERVLPRETTTPPVVARPVTPATPPAVPEPIKRPAAPPEAPRPIPPAPPPRPVPPPTVPAPVAHERPLRTAGEGGSVPPPREPAAPREPELPPPPPPTPFDWESLVGVKLFSGIAGVALVFAAVFFLRYSIDHGWLQPPVRVAIGVLTAVGLLVACELKAARRYPVTANALDAAAIAILFSTFFAAHALWNLIPAFVTFGLLALVTAVAVLLSIRRESLFIAVLGLLGGFATPALLSTGENRPIPLFAYLLLLNVGLAWIAYKKTWPVLTWLTLILTTLYQWGWVIKFLDTASVPLAMGVFIVFPLASVVGLLLGPGARRAGRESGKRDFEHTALLSAAVPLVFAVYLAAVPAYGARPGLLFGFLLIIDIGLLAIALARTRELIHAVGALATILTVAVWLAVSYRPDAWFTLLAFTSGFVVLYLFAPALATRFGRRLEGSAAATPLVAPLLLFVFPVLAGIDGTFARPTALFVWLAVLLLTIAGRSTLAGEGHLYFTAAFFVESGAGGLPLVSQAGSVLSWLVLVMWWGRAAAAVGVIPSLTVLTGLSLITLAGHAWTVKTARAGGEGLRPQFSNGLYLALAGHLFLALLAANSEWAVPPWPIFGSLLVITLATSAASLFTAIPLLHAAGAVAAAFVIASWSSTASASPYGSIALFAAAAASVYAIAWIRLVPDASEHLAARAACAAMFAGEASALIAVASGGAPPFALLLAAHVATLAAILWLTWRYRWKAIALLAVAPAWTAVLQWQTPLGTGGDWRELLILVSALYAVFILYPLALGRRASAERDPFLAAVIATVMFFFGARAAFIAGDLEWMIGSVPIAAGAVLALLLRQLLAIQPPGERDMGRLALVAGAALACVTVAIPLQLEEQWITIGWALEGAALAWLYQRIPHRGLLYSAVGLFAVVFIRLALNPEILLYEPRGTLRILNWYLYTYLLGAAAMLLAGWWLSKTDDRMPPPVPPPSRLLPAGAVILLFLLLNIEIADYYATGPTITFRFGVTLSQDLTYTIGWLAFGMLLLAAGIYLGNRPARVTAVSLIAVTTFKCFLYDLGSLEGLYRVASFVGLALSLALVSLALQKYVLSKPRGVA